jgi:hypothetical protein
MFLFSGRGYWQELMNQSFGHNKLKLLNIQPRALSITQVVLLVLLTTYLVVLQQLGLSLKLELVKLSFN